MKNIHCMIFGHDYEVTRHVTHHVKEYTCKNCKKQLTIDGSGQLTELTPALKEINDVLEHVHMKRHMKTRHIKPSRSAINPAKLLVFKH